MVIVPVMNFRKFYCTLILSICILLSHNVFSQLVVTPAQPAALLASTLAGPGVTILSPTLTCPGIANGTFTATGTPLAMSGGIVLTNGHSAACAGPEGPLVSFTNGTAGDPAMAPFLPPGTATVDACILEFDMVASGDSIGFNYQFGSEEYRNAVCSIYTDVFAFFLSGPGIVGAPNIALVPGTTIPVEINSVNNGGVGTVGGAAHIHCTSLGAGSPFTAYYIDNTGGTTMTYRGYTTKFRAVHEVTPCDTYHLKLSIVDAGNGQYDSGVFLEAASLTTNSYAFDHTTPIGATINGVPHTIVKGCAPTTVNIIAAHANPIPTVLHLSYGGTAVNGTDVTTLPSTVTLPAGSSSIGINVQAIATPPGGAKVLTIYLNGFCEILDSVSINIIDTPSAVILTSDTSVCPGTSFQILVTGTTGLTYSWAPPSGLSSVTAMQPICTPLANNMYTLTATLPGAGCPDITRTLSVSITNPILTMISPDTIICNNASAGLNVLGNLPFIYSWSPSAGLSNATIPNPIAAPSVTTTYTVTASLPGGICLVTATVSVTIADPQVAIITPDTFICAGQSVSIVVNGVSTLSYTWAPTSGLDYPGNMQPIATPFATTTYIITATYPGTPCTATASFTISIFSPIEATASSKLQDCNSIILLKSGPDGADYIYSWAGPSDFSNSLQNPIIANAVPADQGIYSVTITNSVTGCMAQATTSVVINPFSATHLTNVTQDQTIPYGSSIQLNADSALYYWWLPNDGTLNNRDINNPVATPTETTTYTVYGTDSTGCQDSAKITITVLSDSLFLPTAFTPDGDGLNDIFRPVNMKYHKLIEFSIYNRWGQQIFTTSNKEVGWDGTFQGVLQDLGVYNYLFIVGLEDGTNRAFKGNVTLIR